MADARISVEIVPVDGQGRREKKEKKEKKRRKDRVDIELIEEPHPDGAKDRAAGEAADTAPAKPAAELPVVEAIAPSAKPAPKEKARSTEPRSPPCQAPRRI